MAGGSQQQSDPQDVTPEALARLQQPFADVISQLLGFERVAGEDRTVTRVVDEASNRPTQEGGNPQQRTVNVTIPGEDTVVPVGDTSDVARNIPIFEGPFAAPLGANEQAILDQLLGRTTQTSGASDLLERTVSGEFVNSNPFLQDFIEASQRETLRGLEETLSRTLPGRFTQAGQFVQPRGSSAFDRSAAIATEGVANALSDIATNIGFGAFESERGRQQEAALAIPQVNNQEVQGLIANLQAQALPRMIEQLGVEGGLQQFNNQIATLLQVLSLAQGGGSPIIANSSSGSSKGSAAPFIAAAAQGIGAAAASDRRIKKDIQRVGTTSNGLPLYMFRYVWEKSTDELRLGIMAQDVEKVNPDAVFEDAVGFKMVDYGRALA